MRRRYMKRNTTFMKTRKLFKRSKPSWMKTKPKPKNPKTKKIIHKKPSFHGVKKPKKWRPVKIKRPKVHAPKRSKIK